MQRNELASAPSEQPNTSDRRTAGEAQRGQSLLQSWIHDTVGLGWHSDSHNRREVEHYIGEFAKAAPLFLGAVKGKPFAVASAFGLSAASYGLDQIKSGDSFGMQVTEALAGAVKGDEWPNRSK